MLTSSHKEILEAQIPDGWVTEPQAKEILAAVGLDTPKGVLTSDVTAARSFLQAHSSVVLKAVSPEIVHKTEQEAVVVGITDPEILEQEVTRLLSLPGCGQVLVEEMIPGNIELMVGAKNDVQFGPVVVLGLGGTAVEVFRDTAIRLAPVTPRDVVSMKESLASGKILDGFRGRPGVNMAALQDLVVTFSRLIMDLEPWFESADLNPVICTTDRCVIADARIILLPQQA